MAITVVGTSSNAALNGGNVSLSAPAGLQEGDVVLIVGGHARTTNGVGASGTNGGGSTSFTTIVDTTYESTPGAHIYAGYRRMTSDVDTGFTGQGSGNGQDATAYVLMALRGVDPTTPLDVAVQVATNNSNPDSPSITTVTNGAAVISAFFKERPICASPTVPSGYGNLIRDGADDTNDASVGAALKIVATAGVEDPGAWSLCGGTQSTISITIAFRPAAEGVVNVANETDTALSIGRAKAKSIGFASGTDEAVAIMGSRAYTIGTALETSIAANLAQIISIGTALETSSAQGVGLSVAQLVGAATETAVALAVGRSKARPIGIAVDNNFAVRLVLPPPPSLSVRTDQIITAYTPKPLPVIDKPFDPVTRYLLDELKRMQTIVQQLTQAAVVTTNVEPKEPRRGMIRYAVKPWNPLGTGYEGLVQYNGTAWVAI